ncbi:MAG: ABC transporter permease [Clostridiales Family XIII bacterium]|nr:ABC transporter permease [Clostridiales Family XIII bacterium]
MGEYAREYGDRLTDALVQHLRIVGVTLLISIVLALVLTLVIIRFKRLSAIVVRLLGGVYAIPSLALFSLLIPFTGIGEPTAIIVLVAYNQFLLIRNFIAGLDGVDPGVIEAAVGCGMSRMRLLLTVRLPLAFPVMLAGVHLSIISTIGIATIAAAIGAGGIGKLLFEGMRTRNTAKILWGTVLAGGLAIVANFLLLFLEKISGKRLHYNG